MGRQQECACHHAMPLLRRIPRRYCHQLGDLPDQTSGLAAQEGARHSHPLPHTSPDCSCCDQRGPGQTGKGWQPRARVRSRHSEGLVILSCFRAWHTLRRMRVPCSRCVRRLAAASTPCRSLPR